MATPEERLLREHERIAIQTSALARAPLAQSDVSWPGVWGGFLVALGALAIFTALGIAIGVSLIQAAPGSSADPQRWSIGAGLWEFFSFIIALFLGGMVSTRTGLFAARPAVGVHGMLVWVLTSIAVSLVGAVRFVFATVPALHPPGTTPDAMAAVPQPAATITGWATVFVLVVSLLATIAGAASGWRAQTPVRA